MPVAERRGHGSVYRPSGLGVLRLFNGLKYSQPYHVAVQVALVKHGISPLHGLNGGAIADRSTSSLALR